MGRGDHLRVRRSTGYWHHGIDLGDDQVIHYSAESGSLKNVSVCICRWAQFQKRGQIEIVPYEHCHEADEVVARALSRLGEREYNLITNNCEQFARWCKAGNGARNELLQEPGAPSPFEIRAQSPRSTSALALLGTMRGLAALCGWLGVAALLDLYRAWAGRRVGVGAALALPALVAVGVARLNYASGAGVA